MKVRASRTRTSFLLSNEKKEIEISSLRAPQVEDQGKNSMSALLSLRPTIPSFHRSPNQSNPALYIKAGSPMYEWGYSPLNYDQ